MSNDLYQLAFKMIENQSRHPGGSRDPDAFKRLDSGVSLS